MGDHPTKEAIMDLIPSPPCQRTDKGCSYLNFGECFGMLEGESNKKFFWGTEDQMFKSTQIEVGGKKKGVHVQMCSFC